MKVYRTHLKIPFRLRRAISGCGLRLRLAVSLIRLGVRRIASLQKSRVSPMKANFEMGSSQKTIGILLIIIGLLALFTPVTPGSWLVFIGLELLGIRILFVDKIKAWFSGKN